jgi:RsiW-degrading membrane proteinase PrsW (M82 family)
MAQVGIGWLFIRWLIQQDRGPKEPPKALWIAGLLGLAAVPMAMLLETYFLPDIDIMNIHTLPRDQLISMAFMVGLIEEGVKLLPLALFLYGKKFFNEMTDGIIYFAIAGMVFGIVENIGYTLGYGPGTGIARILMGPYIHAGFCVLFGWMLARHKVVGKWPLGIVIGFLASVGVHGLYDFGLFYAHGWSVLMSIATTIAVNIGVFALLRQAQDTDAKLGIAASGDNYYCRSCGAPNPERYLYCTKCGKRT